MKNRLKICLIFDPHTMNFPLEESFGWHTIAHKSPEHLIAKSKVQFESFNKHFGTKAEKCAEIV